MNMKLSNLFYKPKKAMETRVDVGSLISNMVDRRKDALYDRVRLKKGQETQQSFTLFEIPLGQPDQFDGHMKTLVDTNMRSAGMLCRPYDMILMRFLFMFQPSVPEETRNAFIAGYQWTFQILEKYVDRQPLVLASVVGKPEDIIENWGKLDETVSNIEKLGNGVAWDLTGGDGNNYYHYIPPLVQFRLLLEGSPFILDSDLDFYAFLDGVRDFPLQ